MNESMWITCSACQASFQVLLTRAPVNEEPVAAFTEELFHQLNGQQGELGPVKCPKEGCEATIDEFVWSDTHQELPEGVEEAELTRRFQGYARKLAQAVEDAVVGDVSTIAAYVDKLRAQNPGISNDDLARKIVRRNVLKNALVGAITGVPGLVLSIPAAAADVAVSWRIQARMVLAIAYVYGYTQASEAMDLRRDIYILLAGNKAKEAIRYFSMEASVQMTRRAIDRHITREMMVQLWKIIPRRIITKAGEKSLTNFMKLAPIVGAVPGAAIDWAAAGTVGGFAIRYYSGGG